MRQGVRTGGRKGEEGRQEGRKDLWGDNPSGAAQTAVALLEKQKQTETSAWHLTPGAMQIIDCPVSAVDTVYLRNSAFLFAGDTARLSSKEKWQHWSIVQALKATCLHLPGKDLLWLLESGLLSLMNKGRSNLLGKEVTISSMTMFPFH